MLIFLVLVSEQRHIHFGADVCDQKAIAEIFQSAQKLFKCPPTVIVNSAGITMDNLLLKMDINSFQTVVDVNLKVKKQYYIFFPNCNCNYYFMLRNLFHLKYN